MKKYSHIPGVSHYGPPYSIIYADPAWQFKTYSDKGKGKSAEKHYKTSSIESMAAFDIGSISTKDAVCLMWATYPTLPDGLALMKAWGFTYKTVGFTWVKTTKDGKGFSIGQGYHTRSNAEICLLGTKGKVLERKSKSVHQIIAEPRTKHSRKPDCTRDRIVELYGDLPRVELFARERAEGWDSIGNEIQPGICISKTIMDINRAA